MAEADPHYSRKTIMPKITVLPHEELCPQGVTFEAQKGETVAKALLANGVKIPHAAWGACQESRLSCQAKMGDEDITIEIPKYNRNVVGERE